MFLPEERQRRAFLTSTKKKEWMRAAGKDPADWRTKFVKTSRCRERNCRRRLTWGDGSYAFDHKDNNPANNSLSNCYLVCRVCHGKATKIKKRRIFGPFGQVDYETIKVKLRYKKPKKSSQKKRRIRKTKLRKKRRTRRTRRRTSRKR